MPSGHFPEALQYPVLESLIWYSLHFLTHLLVIGLSSLPSGHFLEDGIGLGSLGCFIFSHILVFTFLTSPSLHFLTHLLVIRLNSLSSGHFPEALQCPVLESLIWYSLHFLTHILVIGLSSLPSGHFFVLIIIYLH